MPEKNFLDIYTTHIPSLSALPFPNIDPIIFSIGIISIRWYALAYIVGILLGWWLIRRITSSPKDPIGHAPFDDLMNYAIIGIILGGADWICAWL